MNLDLSSVFREQEVLRNIVSTSILLLALIIIRLIASRYVANSQTQRPENKRTWHVHINNIFSLLLILGMVVIWAAKLQALAISIVALAAAIVIATKELILCFVGGLYKSLVRPFRIGDRIEVGTYRGEVINQSFLSTELMEVGPNKTLSQFTGKTIEVPNSVFLSQPIIKEAKTARYRLHTFCMTHSQEINILAHKQLLEKAAQIVCKDFLVEARSYMKDIQRREGIEAPSTEPRVSINFTGKDYFDFVIRIPIPSLRSHRIEQEIIAKYLQLKQESPVT